MGQSRFLYPQLKAVRVRRYYQKTEQVAQVSSAIPTVGRVENQKSLISLKSQASLYGAHKNKVIHHILKFKNIHSPIGNGPQRGTPLKILK